MTQIQFQIKSMIHEKKGYDKNLEEQIMELKVEIAEFFK